MTDDPIAPIWHAVDRSARAAGCAVRLLDARATPWWSATFAGHRVTLVLAARPGVAFDDWLASLPEADLPVPHRLVADAATERLERTGDHARYRVTLLVLDVA